MNRIFVPFDSAAVSVGADEVAAALTAEAEKRGIAVELVRTGTRGALWAEPMVEVEVAGVRHAYGPVTADDVVSLLDAGFLEGGVHPKALGPVTEMDWFRDQTRLSFARCGVIAPLDLEAYEREGGLAGLRKALETSSDDLIAEVTASGLRGRGGAGFPAGIKWRTVADQPSVEKYICCNADEGDSGTFADRILMEGDPFSLIEGMVIAGIATGAETGFVYLRSEYPAAIATMRQAIAVMEQAGWLGKDIRGSGRSFALHLRRGAGAYICGEESSMLDSLEGKRGEVRAKPPIPAISGLFGQPTLVHNVLSLAAVPWIIAHGGAGYAAHGTGKARGTQPFQLAGNVKRGGLVELPFGVPLRTLIEDYGQGTRTGRPFRAAQLGGPLGAYVDAASLDLAMDYETLAANGAMLGHGGITIFDETVDMAAMARFAFDFCAIESCGKCTPCRVGAVRGRETLDKVIAGTDVSANLALVEDLCELMTDGSLCAMGGLTPMPVRSAMSLFPEDFQARQEGVR